MKSKPLDKCQTKLNDGKSIQSVKCIPYRLTEIASFQKPKLEKRIDPEEKKLTTK